MNKFTPEDVGNGIVAGFFGAIAMVFVVVITLPFLILKTVLSGGR